VPTANCLLPLSEAGILVTGAGGSIGSALSLRLIELAPRKLILLDSSEHAIYRLSAALRKLTPKHTVEIILGSVTDQHLLDHIVNTFSPDIVFHAAAFKHVALLEEQPLAAISNNIIGTYTLMRAVSACKPRVILLSTDKAVSPTSIMGATKRIAELITLTSNGIVLRLVNVLGSHASVTESFLDQMELGQALSITDPLAERYFITLSEAVNLLLLTSIQATPGNLILPNIKESHRILDLAQFISNTCAPNTKLHLQHTCLQDGEKLKESLLTPLETMQLTSIPGAMAISTLLSTVPSISALNEEIHALKLAVSRVDIPAALSSIIKLLPDYKPSQTLLSCCLNPGVECGLGRVL